MTADATLLDGARTTDDVLRAYLDDLRRDELATVDAALLRNAQPMERISLMAERRRLVARRRELQERFVVHAVAWSAAERVQRGAFLAEGVPGEVLDRAGIRD